MSEISLNASMRSNLLSLQQTQMLQDMTQLRLSTGLKVNSAIDNPSSYYTASSLNNRAKDLSQLLNAMGQGIQTIKTASETLETATKFLEQAKAVALQEIDSPNLIAKSKISIDYSKFIKLDKVWYENQIGANDAVVSTAQELKDAIAANKSTIVVYGKIDFYEEAINLKANQKLIGTEHFADINENAKYRTNGEMFSSINTNFSTTVSSRSVVAATNTSISDLRITTNSVNYGSAIHIVGAGVSVNNVDIVINHQSTTQSSGITTGPGSSVDFSGNINMDIRKNGAAFGIYATSSSLNIDNCNLNIKTNSKSISAHSLIIYGSKVNIKNTTIDAEGSRIIRLGADSYGGSTVNINENVKINAKSDILFQLPQSTKVNPDTGIEENILNIKKGSKFYWHDRASNNKSKAWEVLQDTKSRATTANMDITPYSIKNYILTKNIFDDFNYNIGASNYKPFSSILSQYDMLISDASYKGINLLDGASLKVNFNEERSSQIEVKGVDASTKSLGISKNKWDSQNDVQKSLEELEQAINQIRTFSSQFGNYYSIVSSRQDFTENLINVLTEGSDKLTLADMNEESANMLALQTRQQLAINSLSLASQATRSVLNLF